MSTSIAMKLFLAFVSTVVLVASASLSNGISHIYPDLYDTNVVFAVNAINMMTSGDTGPRTAIRIVSATSQVSVGLVYRYQIQVTKGSNNVICDVTVVSKPWLPAPSNRKAQNVSCSPRTRPKEPHHRTTAEMMSTTSTTKAVISTTTIAATTTGPYGPDVTHESLNEEERKALVFFTDEYNSIRSSYQRIIPFDVKVRRETVISNSHPEFKFHFQMRLTRSKCDKLGRHSDGKISLKDCPPILPDLVANPWGRKCKFVVTWIPGSSDKLYTLNKYVC